MALDSPLLSKIRLLAAKAEATTATAETLTASEATFYVINPVLTDETDVNETEDLGSFGTGQSTEGAHRGTLTFRVEACGAGSSGIPVWASTFLPSCNFLATGTTYNYDQDGQVTTTFGLYEQGLVRKLYGARGTFTVTQEYGRPAYFDFTYIGCFTAEADATYLSPSRTKVIPPRNKGITLTADSYAVKCARVVWDIGNQLSMREHEGDANGSGYHGACIYDCRPTATLDPELVTVATKSWVALRTASTEFTLTTTIGGSAGNQIVIASTTAQVRGNSRGEREGKMTSELELQLNSSTPMSIQFT